MPKGRPTIASDEEREAWRMWLEADSRRTFIDAAAHFNIPEGRIRYYMRTLAVADWKVDPFGAAAEVIHGACKRALTHSGSMSQTEYEMLLKTMKEYSE